MQINAKIGNILTYLSGNSFILIKNDSKVQLCNLSDLNCILFLISFNYYLTNFLLLKNEQFFPQNIHRFSNQKSAYDDLK